MDLTTEHDGKSITNTNCPSTLNDVQFAKDFGLGNQSDAWMLV